MVALVLRLCALATSQIRTGSGFRASKSLMELRILESIVIRDTFRIRWCMEASDSFETISGTTGLLGAADGAIVLQKKKRIENTAVMQIVSRDQEDQELTLEFDREHCFWQLSNVEKTIFPRKADPLLYSIASFMVDKSEWTGTATELVELLAKSELQCYATDKVPTPQNLASGLCG